MPFPVAAAIGTVARGVMTRGAASAATRGAARTGSRVGSKPSMGAVARTVVPGSLSSSQFGTTNPSLGNTGTPLSETLRFGAQMQVGTQQ
jgi:hypothetical protein